MKTPIIKKEDAAKGVAYKQTKNNLRPFRQHRKLVRNQKSPSRARQVAKFATTRTLATKLDELAAELKPEQIKEEAALRKIWEEAVKLCEQSFFKKGEALCGYKKLYKADRKWKAFLQAIRVNRRTADDYVARYRAAAEIPPAYREAAEREKVDLGKPAVQNLVPIDDWKKKNNPTTEQVEEAIRKLKEQSKRRAPASAGSSVSAKDRQEQLLHLVKKLYGHVDPELRVKELAQVWKRLQDYFAIAEAA